MPPQLQGNFTKSKEYIQANMRDSLRKSAYASLKYGAQSNMGGSYASRYSNMGGNYGNMAGTSSGYSSMRSGMNSNENKVQYVLPILFFDMGTNNLYKMFRQSAVISYELKRTLIIPYFHTQPTVRDLVEESEPKPEAIGQQDYDHKLLKDPSQGLPLE